MFCDRYFTSGATPALPRAGAERINIGSAGVPDLIDQLVELLLVGIEIGASLRLVANDYDTAFSHLGNALEHWE